MVGTSNLGSWDSQWLKPANDQKYQEAGLVWRRLLHRSWRQLATIRAWRAPCNGGKLPRARIACPVLHPTSQLTSKLKAAGGGFGIANSLRRRLASQNFPDLRKQCFQKQNQRSSTFNTAPKPQNPRPSWSPHFSPVFWCHSGRRRLIVSDAHFTGG